MKDPYLAIVSSSEYSFVYPCDAMELRHLMATSGGSLAVLSEWPGHGHGPEFRIQSDSKVPDIGIIILNLDSDTPSVPLTLEQVNKIIEDYSERRRKQIAASIKENEDSGAYEMAEHLTSSINLEED